MKFYLDSALNWGYYDHKNNELIQEYVREIKKADAEVTIDEGDQYIVIDVPSIQALTKIMKTVDEDLIIERFGDKYPTILIYDGYIE